MPDGRASKYDWDDKKDICYQLYVEEKKTPGQIVKYFAEHFGFQEKWQFPAHKPRMSAVDQEVLVERMRQLWEQNLPVTQIRQTLEGEGWEMGDNEFQRLRKGNGLIRRGMLGAYDTAAGASKKADKKRKRDAVETVQPDIEYSQAWHGGGGSTSMCAATSLYQPGVTPAEAARRAQHLVDVQALSDQAMATGKRRRRIRGYGHLGPDAPGLPPRYGSETTLDECKSFLQLSNDVYNTVRGEFEAICHDMEIERKKTAVESGLWQAAKDRLVGENIHLSATLDPHQPDYERKANALDVICADVTKRMRNRPKKLTISEANNVLGLNPNASKELRRAFYNILEQDQYTTRLACGDEHWNELSQAWFATSPVLQTVMAEGDAHKLKCVELLCRDACKRHNDDCARRDPTRRQFQQKDYGPGPGTARPVVAKTVAKKWAAAIKAESGKTTTTAAVAAIAEKKGKGKKVTKVHAKSKPAITAISLDPALADPEPVPPSEPLAIPAQFRLAPQSQIVGNHPRSWPGELTSRTVAALHQAATNKAGAARVTKVHGMIKSEGGSGEESYGIERNEELDVYLQAAGEEGASFLVLLEGGYA
ncbi:hypothetical protein LTR53_002162 [Teratosphaeriaceae sp. CCFEE 6253]|nr:hypothetical protein LTR53_002162 [Teratosphaeriaceae sp. CCFEE 6253]